jgi:hypothetical protein
MEVRVKLLPLKVEVAALETAGSSYPALHEKYREPGQLTWYRD